MKAKKLIFIADTHSYHKKFQIPNGDFIIHCGDISGRGGLSEIIDFADWFGSLPHKYKIMIPGNHDFIFERGYDCDIAYEMLDSAGIIHLNDEAVELGGIKFWGSPVSPFFGGWAFNRFRGSEIEHHWNKIPEGTDVLITHGPPAYIGNLSKVLEGTDEGCEDLYRAIKRINPKISCFGHIHEGWGSYKDEKTLYINCSLLNRKYEPTNRPIEIRYSGGKFSLDKPNTNWKL